MRRLAALLLLSLVLPLTTAGEARADAPSAEAPAATPATTAATTAVAQEERDAFLVIGPHIGMTMPQLFSDLGFWPIFGLEIGWIAPFDAGAMRRPLQISLDTLYTAPGASGSGESAWLGEDGAEYAWDLRQKMLIFQLGFLWRFLPPSSLVRPYATVGPRLFLMETVLEARGNGDEDFGTNRETNHEFGFAFGGGLDISAGPGTAFATLLLSTSNLDQRITGDTNTGTMSLSIGYRLWF